MGLFIQLVNRNLKKALPFIAAMALAGCTLAQTAEPAPTPAPTVSNAPDLRGQKITFLAITPHMEAARALAGWFQQETGAVVQVAEVGYSDLLDKTLADASLLTPRFDVLTIWYPSLGTLAEADALADLTGFVADNQAVIQPDDFIAGLYDPYTLYRGKRWAIPFDGDIHMLFYRKSLLKKYGLTPPQTWNDYLNVARTITEGESNNGIYGSAIMGTPSAMLVTSSFLNRLGSYGGRLMDENGRPVVNSPEAVAALTAMVKESVFALPTPPETDYDVARDAFLIGKVAMVEQWTDLGVMAEDAGQSMVQGDWGVVQMPVGFGKKAGRAAALNGGFSLGLARRAPNARVAREFLLFAARPDIALRLSTINGGVDPTRVSVLTSAEYRRFAPQVSQAAQVAMENAVAWPNSPEMPVLVDILSNNLVLALEGSKSPRQALEDTQARWLDIVLGSGLAESRR